VRRCFAGDTGARGDNSKPACTVPGAVSLRRLVARPSTNADYFPIGVWLQSPRNAKRFKDAGINLYIGLWRGPTLAQLVELREAGMGLVCGQNSVGPSNRENSVIVGWMHGDEPR